MKKSVILCPVDYSAGTKLAISPADDLASVGTSKVILLHVIDPDTSAISINQSIKTGFCRGCVSRTSMSMKLIGNR